MQGNSFHNDINKVADMLIMDKESFLQSYSYLTEADYYETLKTLLYNNFTLYERKEFKNYLLEEGYTKAAKLYFNF